MGQVDHMKYHRHSGFSSKARFAASASILALSLVLTGCNTDQVFTNGPELSEQQMAMVPVGSSRDQVLLALGTPSTTGTFDNEVFYYISQKRKRKLAYQKLKLVEQRVLAVYFDETDTVAQIADYGLQDGKVFDFISRTTPTGGKDQTLLSRLFSRQGSKKKAPPVSIPGGGDSF